MGEQRAHSLGKRTFRRVASGSYINWLLSGFCLFPFFSWRFSYLEEFLHRHILTYLSFHVFV